MVKSPAKVRFIGNPDSYKLMGPSHIHDIILDQTVTFNDDGFSTLKEPIFSHEIFIEGDPLDFTYRFTVGQIYEAYFLEYWQGKRTSPLVKDNSGEITNFNPLEDFEIVEDCDNVLNMKEAVVRCVTHKLDDQLLGIKYEREYAALGLSKKNFAEIYYLVMDESHDCYFYSAKYFEIVDDPYGLLDYETGQYVYNWS